MIKMKRLLLTMALTISVVATTFALDSPGTGAVGCSIPTIFAPYSVGSGVRAYAEFYCNTGGAHTYQTCLQQNGVIIRCNYIYTSQFSSIVTATCNYDGISGGQFKTHAYLYNGNFGGLLVYKASATSWLNHVYDC